MPALSYPGVYVQEVAGGVRPLDTASTSTAAFVGLSEMGPDTGAGLVTNWTDFQRVYGSFIADGHLAHGVFQYFANGGRQCYIARVTRRDAAVADVTVHNRAASPVAGMRFSAKSKGEWGNTLLLQIEDATLDPGNLFKLTVRRQTDPATVPDSPQDLPPLEVFDNLSVDPASPAYVVDVVGQASGLIGVQVLSGNNATQHGVHRGGLSPTLPLDTHLGFRISLDGDGYQPVTLATGASTATALSDVASAIETAVHALTKRKASTDPAAFSAFTCTAETAGSQSRLVLRSGTQAATSSVRVQPAATHDATALLRIGEAAGGRSEDGIAPRRPAAVSLLQVGDSGIAAPVTAATAGSDGVAELTESSFGDAFSRLDHVTDFSLLAVPGESTPAMADLGMAYCANRPLQDVFYLAETGRGDDTVADATAFRSRLTTSNSYGALYFPWVKSLDPSGRSAEPILLPPSGCVAGLYARIDASRGVWKAPAGTEAGLNGVVGLGAELSDVDHGNLNPRGIDVIRRFPGAGVVVFGARTISADPQWRYVPVRRTAIMLRVSIYNGIQWAVFEPNDEPLWAQLRLSIGSFMTTLFRQGAFQGSTPSEAFFVKCDAETTTQADVDAGVVNVLVGFAPLKPAEFVVVKISQQAGLASG
ncbi:phage tail sheath family protein [Streptomyces sp. NRRL B-3229]|uniref:phage tail sheath family protein n=1 Tax=Streptomyces sp. NRRL B-3229 TaxID=1463836 RepID=UPI00068BE86B|nr:phage tail sheath subtilisin-like domain-containing protein [Streptomyces sp. NRRL B-3229]